MLMDSETRYCPVCRADWQASEIPAKSRQYYAPSATHYSRLIGIETRSYDGVSYWQCPDCKATWDRWTGALTACQRCGSSNVRWVGYSARALRRAARYPNQRRLSHAVRDVEECQTCKHAWYYARTGRRITPHQFQRG